MEVKELIDILNTYNADDEIKMAIGYDWRYNSYNSREIIKVLKINENKKAWVKEELLIIGK